MPDASVSPLVGQTLGKCRIEKLLGRGGMGEVYLAKHLTLNKPVAVKVLPAGTDDGQRQAMVKRFIREAQQAARLEHPNVVQVYDVGLQNGRHFIVMQYVAGMSVEELVRKRGRLPASEALVLIGQAAAGLGAAHEQNIIHRDVKPSNLLVDEGGRLKVADFGLSREVNADSSLSQTGQILGTPNFISPEQAKGDRALDGRTDIYSLGATLFYLLTGRALFEATTPVSVLVKHVTEAPPALSTVLPGASPALQALLDRMLAKDPDRRYPNCQALLADLNTLTSASAPANASTSATVIRGPGEGASSPRSTPSAEPALAGGRATPTMAGIQPAAPRRRWLWIAIPAGAILLFLGLAAAGWTAGAPSRAALADAESWWKAHPLEYVEAARRFDDIFKRYPTMPAGKQASRRAEQVRMQWTQEAEQAGRQCLERAREFEKSDDYARAIEAIAAFPTCFAGTPAAVKVSEAHAALKDKALQHRIAARADEFSRAMLHEDMAAALKYVDPVWVREEGRNGVEVGLRVIAGLGKLLKASLRVTDVRLSGERDRATVEIVVQVGENPPKTSPPQEWVCREGEWYLGKSQNPPDRRPKPERDRPPRRPPDDSPK
ncbi:MAG: serine/threonine protein kinase [Planctomycetes bacterium]|nr:serine/threonine protein kinase [Planctomycetota bacterium]